jgi:hypothetical protein
MAASKDPSIAAGSQVLENPPQSLINIDFEIQRLTFSDGKQVLYSHITFICHLITILRLNSLLIPYLFVTFILFICRVLNLPKYLLPTLPTLCLSKAKV